MITTVTKEVILCDNEGCSNDCCASSHAMIVKVGRPAIRQPGRESGFGPLVYLENEHRERHFCSGTCLKQAVVNNKVF